MKKQLSGGKGIIFKESNWKMGVGFRATQIYVVIQFFEEIFKSPLLEDEVGWREGLSCILKSLSNEWRLKLVMPFTAEEVKDAMFQLGPTRLQEFTISRLFSTRNFGIWLRRR
ncbi:hypothetical protein QQ045_014589 [Rhodiola kirilowii]